MAPVEYRYELRRGDEIVVTGHLTRETALEVGEQVSIGGYLGVVRAIEPTLGARELHLIVRVLEDGRAAG